MFAELLGWESGVSWEASRTIGNVGMEKSAEEIERERLSCKLWHYALD
jgi:hypothetical protein